jgi:hypothetical protein
VVTGAGEKGGRGVGKRWRVTCHAACGGGSDGVSARRCASINASECGGCAGVSVNLEGRHLAVVLPVHVTDPGSAAALLTVKHVKVEVLPYGCLQYSHAAINRLAARAAASQSVAERRQLVEQMFMVPIWVSLDQVEIFAAQMDLDASRVVSSGSAQVGNGVVRRVGPSLVLPISMSAELKLSQMRSDASLPVCFVNLNIPALVPTHPLL